MDYYRQLYKQTIEQLCEERKQHEKERAEIIVKQVELQPLKPDSVYIVTFPEDSTIETINNVCRVLNELGKHKDISFVPSCHAFKIKGGK